MSESVAAVGGYFEWECALQNNAPYSSAHAFQSARAAFLALLTAGKPTRVWLPFYGCGVMQRAAEEAGVRCEFYDIDANLDIASPVHLSASDWLLSVNYFGISALPQQRLLARFPAQQVIADHAQAFFAPPPDCLATLYSPRKFFGVPDGGYLVTSLPIQAPSQQDNESLARSQHLLLRLAASPEAGYAAYQAAERTLENITPMRMSALTQRLLGAIDSNAVRERRNQNFRFLHEQLGTINEWAVQSFLGDMSQLNGPLCYPLLISANGLREALVAERVFIPTYWPEIKTQFAGQGAALAGEGRLFARALVNNLLAVPCDQRYSTRDLERVVAIIRRASGA